MMTTLDQEHIADHRQSARHQTVRHCLVSGERLEKSAMIRFVLGPSGEVTPDPAERLPGRGMWLCAKRGTLEAAVSKRLFAKAARAAVSVPADLIQRLETLLVRRCQDRIGMARRAGQAVMGHEKAASWLKAGKAALIIMAADAGGSAQEIGFDKMVKSALTGEELGRVFDRERTVYVAVADGPMAEQLHVDLQRLAGLRQTQNHKTNKDRAIKALG
ncbi:MAG: RNA-binding protein [Rhodospirillales bacterium]